MYFYVGSVLTVEWTNQHSCGNDNNDCDIVLQYMCGPEVRDGFPNGDANQPNTPDYCDPANPAAGCNKNRFNTKDGQGNLIYGLHESYDYYDKCYCRERNKGLFTADQAVNNNRGATASRQNQNGNNVRNNPGRGENANHGYECPEERDYYPYWHPTPWIDIAILTTRTKYCDFMKANSQNVAPSYECLFGAKNYPVDNNNQRQQAANNAKDCLAQGGTWTYYPPKGVPPPVCERAPFSRDNHLGNGLDGHANRYNWTIPNTPSPNCVLRIRYNITTMDTGTAGIPYSELTSQHNGVARSPVTNNPALFHSFNKDPPTAYRLKLAINTNQFGRTFQDRSHAFEIRSRPGGMDSATRIFNLNVRGKRGNIVQTYPATEYDFVPPILHTKVGDFIHVQWTGSQNGAYPNNQDGEGTDKTDRSNIVQIRGNAIGGNIHVMLNDTTVTMPWATSTMNALAWIGQTACSEDQAVINNNQNAQNCAKLNGATTPYYDAGLLKVEKAMVFNYMSSRNNNFSNRSQKAQIYSTQPVQTFAIVLLSLSAAGVAAGGAVALIAKLAPTSVVGAAA